MLIDTDPELGHALRVEGYNVSEGTFGQPYSVGRRGVLTRVDWSSVDLDGHEDRDIYVIDMADADTSDLPASSPEMGVEGVYTQSRGQEGVVDPRPVAAEWAQRGLDLAFEHGAAFIVFAGPPNSEDVRVYSEEAFGIGLQTLGDAEVSIWSLLSAMAEFSVEAHFGDEITVRPDSWPLCSLLRPYFDDAVYTCTFIPEYGIEKRFVMLATEKYGRLVAGLIVGPKDKGLVLLLPQVNDKAGLVQELIESFLPGCCPHLFPEVEGGQWVERDEYELQEVVSLRRQITEVRQREAQAVAELEQRVAAAREQWGWLHTLLTGSGRELVIAVKEALRTIGFEQVADVDAGLAVGEQKREDLRIEDDGPEVLIEVKGIKGLPREEESLRADQYVKPRMQGLGHTNVRSLALINQQRHLPALERDNENVFQRDVVTNAEQRDMGLMTSWDLFTLVRAFLKHEWRPEDVKALFYRAGRIAPVPLHYKQAGVVGHQWPKPSVVLLRLSEHGIRVGDRIAFRLPHGWEEQEIVSLRVDDADVNEVSQGQEVTVQIPLAASAKLDGLMVYVVRRDEADAPRRERGALSSNSTHDAR